MANGEKQKFDEISSRNLEANIIIETQKEKLTENLAQKLGISRETTDKLIKFDTENSIDKLKQELAKIKSIDKTKYDEEYELVEIKNIIKEIQFLQKEIKSESRTKIASLNDSLKGEIESSKINSKFPASSKIFPPEFLKKAERSETFGENLAGITVGTIDSVYKIGKLPIDLLVGLAKSPIHGYKLATREAETDSFKNV